MQKAYEELKQIIVEIHQGKGVLMLYDMGSLKEMAEVIASETGIELKRFVFLQLGWLYSVHVKQVIILLWMTYIMK